MDKTAKKRLAARLRAKGEDDTKLWKTPTKRRTAAVKPSSNFYPFASNQSKKG